MLFSVVIPTYNREKVVMRAVESVLKQTFHDFEIIIVDDGSQDHTKDVLGTLDDKRIICISQDNKGATAARNMGIANSKGKYVSFLDSDDVWLPEMLEKQLAVYNSDEDIGWVYTNVQGIDSQGNTYPFGVPLGIYGNIFPDALKQGYVAPTTVISAKRDALISVGLFDVNLPASQDDDICFKLARSYKCGYVPEVMASMLFDPDNRISDNKYKVAKGWWMLWNKYEDDVVKYCGKDVMASHFFHCARRFSICKDFDMMNLAIEKAIRYGGSLSLLKKVFLTITCKGIARPLSEKVLNKLIK